MAMLICMRRHSIDLICAMLAVYNKFETLGPMDGGRGDGETSEALLDALLKAGAEPMATFKEFWKRTIAVSTERCHVIKDGTNLADLVVNNDLDVLFALKMGSLQTGRNGTL